MIDGCDTRSLILYALLSRRNFGLRRYSAAWRDHLVRLQVQQYREGMGARDGGVRAEEAEPEQELAERSEVPAA